MLPQSPHNYGRKALFLSSQRKVFTIICLLTLLTPTKIFAFRFQSRFVRHSVARRRPFLLIGSTSHAGFFNNISGHKRHSETCFHTLGNSCTPEKGNSMASKVALHWFRKGLRLHDNPAFLDACNEADKVYPVFVLDPHFADPEKVGVNRYNFLLESLRDLDRQLQGRGSRLFVLRGQPVPCLEQAIRDWGVTHLTFEIDSEPYAKKRDAEARAAAAAAGCTTVRAHPGHTLHELERYVGLLRGKPAPTTYTSFLKLFGQAGAPPAPLPPPPPGAAASALPPAAGHDPGVHGVPSLQDLGYPEKEGPSLFPGGETEAIARMERCLNRRAWIAGFEKPKTSPNSLEPSTTVLSPYLKFGCLSPRLFYHRVQEIYDAFPKHASPPVSLHGQLLWREFFYLCGYTVPNFSKMEGNPICKQVPWAEGPEAEARLAAWAGARTGYPWIDAAMTQLRQEGWLHHLARHAVACFLTRGDLWVSWEKGAAVFDRLLLDADWSLNSANWMWLSCSSFFYQYFRCYSPVAFGKKTDPDGEYIKKYLPQLRNFPKKYIYEPWLAPKSMQESCGCVIGVDYPEPIVDHSIVSKENMAKMKQAYANQPGSAEGSSASLPLSGRGAITGEAAAAGESRSGAKKRPGKKTTAKEEQKMDSASSGTAGKKKVNGGPAIAGTSKKKQKTLLEGGFGKQHGMDGDGK